MAESGKVPAGASHTDPSFTLPRTEVSGTVTTSVAWPAVTVIVAPSPANTSTPDGTAQLIVPVGAPPCSGMPPPPGMAAAYGTERLTPPERTARAS